MPRRRDDDAPSHARARSRRRRGRGDASETRRKKRPLPEASGRVARERRRARGPIAAAPPVDLIRVDIMAARGGANASVHARTRENARALVVRSRARRARGEGDAGWTRRGAIRSPANEGVGESDEDDDEGSTVRARARESARRVASTSVSTATVRARGVGRVKTATRGGRRGGGGGGARRGDERARVDFAVVGSGIAGLSYALDAAEHGDVAVITKARAFEAATSYAQGGISAVVDKLDSVDEHVRDTCVAGGYLCDERAVRVMVEDSKSAVETLIERGTRFTRDAMDGSLHLAREGGHSRHRIVHADDMTGKEIERALLEAARAHPRIQFHEYHFAMELLKTRDGERCAGVLVVDEARGVTKEFVATSTVLACGGAGHLFPSTTNPAVSTGDGIAMATRAGVAVANMEFMQFHPTALYTGEGGAPKMSPNENAFLITEAVRGHGGRLYNALGERFMSRYDEREELAPRDVVARSIDSEMKRTGSPCVFLDITHVDGDDVRRNFPGIAAELDKRGIDMTKDRIPVVPAAHYMCGGISTNENGETSLRGLFACGEVAYTGVHGANRLASNSLLEGIVFARRAVVSVANELAALRAELPSSDADDERLRQWLDEQCEDLSRGSVMKNFTYEHGDWEKEVRREIQQTMWNAAGIVRTTVEMEGALFKLQELAFESEAHLAKMKGYTMQSAEISNLIVAGQLMLRCALMRRESRGLHYTLDHPEPVESEKRPTLAFGDVPVRAPAAAR